MIEKLIGPELGPETGAEVVVLPSEPEVAAQAVAAETGLLPVDKDTIGRVRSLGVEIDRLGVAQMGRGFVFLTQTAMAQCIDKLSQGLNSGELDPLKVASALAQLSKAMVSCVGSNRPMTLVPVSPLNSRRTFSPYAKVEFVNVNINPGPDHERKE